MNGELVLCAGCNRHVYAEDSACPFCHRAPARGMAGKAIVVALSTGLSLVGCRGPEAPVPAYGIPPSTATAMPPPPSSATATPQPSASAPAIDPGRMNAPMYGMPPQPPQPK